MDVKDFGKYSKPGGIERLVNVWYIQQPGFES